MMGKAPVWSEKIVLVGWKDTNALFVFYVGWVAGERLQFVWLTECFVIVGGDDPRQY